MKKRVLSALLAGIMLFAALQGSVLPSAAAANNEPSVAVWVNGNWVAAKSLAGLSGEQWIDLPIAASVLKDSGEGTGATNYVRIASNVANGTAQETQVRLYTSDCAASDTFVSHNWWVDGDWAVLNGVNADYAIEGWNGAQWVPIHKEGAAAAEAGLTLGRVSSTDYLGYARNLWTENNTLENYSDFRVRIHLLVGTRLSVASGNIQNLFPAANYLGCAYCEVCGGCTCASCTLAHERCICGSLPADRGDPAVGIYVNGSWVSAVSVKGMAGQTWLEFPIGADALTDTGAGGGAVNYVRLTAKCANADALATRLQLLFTPTESSNTYVSHNWWVDSDWTLVEGKNADLVIEGWNGTAWERIHSDTNAYDGSIAQQLGKQNTGEYQGFVRNIWVSSGTIKRYSNFRVRVHVLIGTCISEDTGDITALFPPENYRTCAFCPDCGGCMAESCSLGHVLCTCETASPKIVSAALRLNHSIDMLYSVQLPAGFTHPVLTVNGTALTQYTQQEDGTLQFVYEGITPQKMCDELNAELTAEKDGRTASCRMEHYSVRNYCENLLNSVYCEADPTLKTLLSDLLTYGAASQIYVDYETQTLATDGLELTPSVFTELPAKAAAFAGTADPHTCWTSAALSLKNNLTFRFGFFADDVDGLAVCFDFAGRNETVTEFTPCGNGNYLVCLDNVSATEFDLPVTAQFLRNGTPVGNSLTYSVNTFISVKQNDEDEALRALVRALYCYGAAAVKYEAYHPYSDMPVDMTANREQPSGKRETAVSLNGEWELAPDFLAKRTEVLLGNEASVIKNSLVGRTLGMKLTVSAAGANNYTSARAYLLAASDAQTKDGGSLTVFVRVNGGRWVSTDCSGYANDWNHWIDLGLAASDLHAGENSIEIKSNAASGLWLYGSLQSGAAGYQIKNGVTSSAGMNYLIGLCTFTAPTTWGSATVPAAAEMDLKLPYTGAVFPDTYDGVVWYRKTFTYTADAAQQWLHFNAVDYKADVWLNGEYLGSHEGGYTGFEFCVTDALAAGENTLVVRVVDQSWTEEAGKDIFPIKETLAGFSQDSRGMNYCGIWQSVYLESRGCVAVDEIYVNSTDSTVKVTLCSPEAAAVQTALTLCIPELHTEISRTLTVPTGKSEYLFDVDLSAAEKWDPDHPVLYEITASAACANGTDTLTDSFGISKMTVSGNQFVHNGEPIFLTGMLHWGSYYENYTSAVSKTRVRYELSQLKTAGFNAVKYCLTCPPDYILDICDEMGMFVYIEYPVWNVTQTQAFFERAYLQMPALIKAGRTHPCVVMSDFDCEDHGFTEDMATLMQWCIATGKTLDAKRVYTDNSGNEEHTYGDYATRHPYFQVAAYRDDLRNTVANSNGQPVVLGEFDDVSVLRDIEALNALAPSGYTWYHNYFGEIDHGTILRNAGWTETAVNDAIESSHSNAQELMKYFVETAKAQQGVGALFLTQMTESANGWADGFLDDCYRPNYEASVLRRAAQENALLLPMNSVNFYQGKTYSLTPKVSLYGGSDLTDAELSYVIARGDTVISEGVCASHLSAESGGLRELGTLPVCFPQTDSADALTIKLTLTQNGRTVAANEWNVWSYPADRLADLAQQTVRYYDPSGTLTYDWAKNGILPYTGGSAAVIITTEMTAEIESCLRAGSKVIYVGPSSGIIDSVYTTDYDRFSFAYAPSRGNFLSDSLKTGGWGGLQFTDLATPFYLVQRSDCETLFGRINITGGTLGSYVTACAVGSGLLVQTTFRLHSRSVDYSGGFDRLTASGENAIGSFILEQLILYAISCG